MKLEQEIWGDREISNEHKLYVATVEESLKEYIEKGRIPEDVALSILQKVEGYPKTFDSEEDARHQARAFFEMQVMPIIFQFDELLKGEADLATEQGNLLIKKEDLENKSTDLYRGKIKKIEDTLDWIDNNELDILNERENLKREILD